ncbi:FAD-dependent oxidoreductase [bacterium]|jgi:NADH:ubiquinone reductase (H+-translocating)|nr:FAD-dependent oxidoreductase [bacterium]
MTRILILGGGFAAMSVAKELRKRSKRNPDIQITLVSENNYFLFQPMLPGVAAGTVEATHIVKPIRRLCKGIQFHRAKVDEINTSTKQVRIVGKDYTRQKWIEYDHLVLALGSSTDLTCTPGMSEHSLPIKTLGDAFFLRNELINKLEMAAIEPDLNYRKKLLTFLVVGGGFSGVETIGEVGDMLREAVKQYPSIPKDEIRLILIHSRDTILNELSKKLGSYAQNKLRKRGTELYLSARVTEVTPDKVILDSGQEFDCKTVICTTGSAPQRVISELPFTNTKGRVDTNAMCQAVQRGSEGEITGICPNIWALGDCAFIPNIAVKPTEKNPHPLCPPTAQFAIRMGKVCGRNILASIKSKRLKEFKYKALGQLATIGHHTGVAKIFGFRFSGFIAFFLWRFIYWTKLPGIYSKCRVAIDWAMHLIFPIDITQLNVYRTEKVDRSHYQKGAYIFRQGDIADTFYIIEKGKIQIIKEHGDGTETILAVQKEGDTFGEMGLMKKAPRTASVRCLTPVGVLKVNRHDFKALTSSYSTLNEQLNDRVNSITRENANIVGNFVEKAIIPVHDHFPELSESVLTEESSSEETPEKELNLGNPNLTNDQQSTNTDVENKADIQPDYPDHPDLDTQTEHEHKTEQVEKTESNEPAKPEQDANAQEKNITASDLMQQLEDDPTNPALLIQVGDTYVHSGRFNEALDYFHKANKLRPLHVSILARIGHTYRKQGEYIKAIDTLKIAIEKDINNIFVIANLAACYMALKHFDAAEKLYRYALHKTPNDLALLSSFGECLRLQGQYLKAEEVLRFALQTNPSQVHLLNSLGDCLLKQNKVIEAESIFAIAHDLSSEQ